MNTMERDGPPADAQGPTVPRMLVGIELHRFREAAGITPELAAYEIRASRSKISRMENGLVRFKERDVTDLLKLYSVTDQAIVTRLVTLAR
jgi:transcriptional regulator with XRE-family HTH domain